MTNGFLFLTTNKLGHYKSYGELCHSLAGEGNVAESANIADIIGCESLVLIDGDSQHLALAPFVILRALLGRPSLFLSVRTEDLLGSRLKSRVKRRLIQLLLKFKRVSYVSIHYPQLCQYEGRYVTKCIYDPQLWDLPFIESKSETPCEVLGQKGYLLVLGALNEKRCKNELISSVSSFGDIPVVFAGKMDLEDEKKLKNIPNITLVNRYVSDAEILALYANAGFVYAYYDQSVNRPSGIFGRAVQLGLPVVIRKGGYLERQYGNYEKIISLSSLEYLGKMLAGEPLGFVDPASRVSFDHSEILRRLL
ncbi:hypothetical protein IMCC21906_00153 [Spongiibacter sp. IMCC21906]|uniref:hypothetical protein n=1 Tax=Spongiibacter sp. IMCC21906 TaxID=1620392 RepID=UPI00062DDF4B|nr:hypothetical protein [Spongiibacter sp. IMCC21906]AKH67847.1 hypothetical protein IMCC21906_00153 [Spongiibacter sp. IMCC21906]